MIFVIATISILFSFFYKYAFVITNQFTQFPIILSLLDPNYLTNDWYVTVSREFGPRTIYALYMSQTARILTLPSAVFLNYVLYVFFVAYPTYLLSYHFFKRRFIALCTTICILFGTSITLGGNLVMTRDLSAPQLPLALSLMGITLLVKRNYFFSAIFFSLSSYLHPLGIESAFLFYASMTLVFVSMKKSVLPLIKTSILPYFLFSLPALLLYAIGGSKSNVSSSTKIDILAYMRNPHHFVPSTWQFNEYIFFLAFLLLTSSFLYAMRKHINNDSYRFLFISTTAILFACLIGYLSVEVIPFYPLVVAQPFRMTLYLYWLGAIVILSSSFRASLQNRHYLTLFLTIPLFFSTQWYEQTIGKVTVLTLFLSVLLIVFFKKIPKGVFVFLLFFYFSLFSYHDRFNFSSYIPHPTDETELALWVKNHTPPDTIFLVPPEFEQFRLISNRAIVADWKAFPFQEEAMIEWADRMCAIALISQCNYRFIKQDIVYQGYRKNTLETLLLLKEKYGFSYVVTDFEILPLTPVFQNRFRLYKLS